MSEYVRETSAEAYRTIKENGLLSERRLQVYDYLYQHGPCTANELVNRAGKRSTLGNQNVVTRLGELRAMGVVKELGTRQCEVTGMRVIVWDVTRELPKKLEKGLSRSRKEIRKDLMELLRKIHDYSATQDDLEFRAAVIRAIEVAAEL